MSLSVFKRGESISLLVRLYHNFGLHLLSMTRHHGEMFTVKYLKACQLAVQRYIAGNPVKSLREIEPDFPFPRLSHGGLPVIIGTRHRNSISRGSISVIRF